MVFDVPHAVCPKCGSKGLYITQEDYKPVVIKCRHFSKCGWEVDLKQFWPKKEVEDCEKCPVGPPIKGIVRAACVGCARKEIEKKEAES
jgi:hypothetical protein